MSDETHATVKRIDLEGGFWGMLSDDGIRYYPVDLPAEFQEDGLRLACRLEGVAVFTTAQWGRTVRVLEARRLV